MATLRVRRSADNHCQLCSTGAGGASALRRQNCAGPITWKHWGLFPVHLLRGSIAKDPCPRACSAQKLIPQEHLEYYGFFCCSHRVRMILLYSQFVIFKFHTLIWHSISSIKYNVLFIMLLVCDQSYLAQWRYLLKLMSMSIFECCDRFAFCGLWNWFHEYQVRWGYS